MKKEEKLKLNLDSLCIYRELFQEKIGLKFKILADKLTEDSSFGDCINAYNEFTYALFKKSKNLSFKESIVDDMLLNNNPFNLSLESDAKISDFIKEGIKNELTCLSNIVTVNSKVIKEIMQYKYGENGVVAKKIEGLLNWGIENNKYKAKNQTDFEKTKEKIINTEDLGKIANDLIAFHSNNGTGRATAFSAFVWERFDNEEEGRLREIAEPDPIRLKDLIGYESQKKEIEDNTVNFLKGVPSNNLLLYGSRGTGKSSTVKALINEYYKDGLRLIEVDKDQLSDFTRIIRLLRHKKQKFIIFVDDLVFQENEASYSALKTILEGRIENRPDNILIYATTNRRHLVQEKFSDRGDDVHSKDTKEEQLSLADRFGITISFFAPDQNEFLEIVDGIVASRGLNIDIEYLHAEALKWEKWHNGRSPRSAKQFIDWLEGNLNIN